MIRRRTRKTTVTPEMSPATSSTLTAFYTRTTNFTKMSRRYWINKNSLRIFKAILQRCAYLCMCVSTLCVSSVSGNDCNIFVVSCCFRYQDCCEVTDAKKIEKKRSRLGGLHICGNAVRFESDCHTRLYGFLTLTEACKRLHSRDQKICDLVKGAHSVRFSMKGSQVRLRRLAPGGAQRPRKEIGRKYRIRCVIVPTVKAGQSQS